MNVPMVGASGARLHARDVGHRDVRLEDLLGDHHPQAGIELGRAARQQGGLPAAVLPEDRDAILCVMPSDHAIADLDTFVAGVRQAATVAGTAASAIPSVTLYADARGHHFSEGQINGATFNPLAPFGGYKQSGTGRELGRHGLEEFLQVKALQR